MATKIIYTVLIVALWQVGAPHMLLTTAHTIDSLGACQGISVQKDAIFLYGDREVGMIRKYKMAGDSLVYQGLEMRLTQNDTDVINHPTGLAMHEGFPVFLGNSIRLNKEGTSWRAVIYRIDWPGLQRTKTLDGNLQQVIEDDTCIQGTRPEYVQYNKKWFVATADYGNKKNEVRLYDPLKLSTARKTSDHAVLVRKFSCSPWVQNLLWIPEKGWLLLIQNQIEGRKWRFTYIDLAKSIERGLEQVVKVVDIDRTDELEGFSFLPNKATGIGVTSSRRDNVNMFSINW